VGANVWLNAEDDWVPAVIKEVQGKDIKFLSEYGKEYVFSKSSLSRDQITAMHSTSIGDVDDMARLGDLHEASILNNLAKRYKKDTIYTFIGSIMVAVNPYKVIGDTYNKSSMKSYNNTYLGDKPPHIYAIANEAYYSLWRKGGNQCVLISGESGAGKTESTKHILQYLSDMSRNCGVSEEGVNVEEAILQSSPILEAFGNAKTIYNNNSSRFGKFIKLNFTDKGNIQGGQVVDYLLEKNRVVRQNPGERNFHIFYALLSGVTDEQRGDLCLYNPSGYYYLKQSGCITDPTIDDRQDFLNVLV